jgi:HSP20 family protein
MWRANLKNRAFDRMGEQWAPLIDPNHFLGRSAFDIPYHGPEKAPAASIVRRNELLTLEIKVPGYKREELEVEVNHDLLFVKGNKPAEPTVLDSKLVSDELHQDSFERVFKLAPAIAREGITAQLRKDVLWIQFVDVPKQDERIQRQVEIA